MKISRAAAGSTSPIVHAPVVVDHDAVQRGPLERDHFGGLLLPVRLEQLLLQQVAGDAGYPLRLDRRQPAAVQPRGLHQLGGDQPARRLLAQVRARMAPELDAARAEVPLLVVALAADIAEQAGQHRQVDLLVGGRRAVEPPAVLGDHGVQLRMDVAPLAHAPRTDELLAQPLLLLAVAELVRACGTRHFGRGRRALLRSTATASGSRRTRTSHRRTSCASRRPPAACSSGRSRTSCTLSADAMISTSCSAWRSRASRIMRPTRGSSGRRGELAARSASARCRRPPRPARPSSA